MSQRGGEAYITYMPTSHIHRINDLYKPTGQVFHAILEYQTIELDTIILNFGRACKQTIAILKIEALTAT